MNVARLWQQQGFGSGWDSFQMPGIVVPDGWPNWDDTGDDTYGDTITTNVAGPRTRNATELAAAVKAAGGKLNVSGNDSAMIVALNNSLRFSVTNAGNGYYTIEDRLAGNSTLLIAGGVAALLVVLALVSGK